MLAQGSPGQVLTTENLSHAYGISCQVAGAGEEFRLRLEESPAALHAQEQLLKEILQEA